jgi:hypothetical protein
VSRRVIAHQLSLLGDAPTPCLAWEPTFCQWTICGIPIPPTDDALRQAAMLTRESAAPSNREGTAP